MFTNNGGQDVAVPGALAPMLRGEPPPPGFYLATGPRFLPSWILRALGPFLGRGAEIFWIDGATPFDAYGSSQAARSRSDDPHAMLHHVKLARAFNLYQLETMVCQKVPRLWKGELVVVSDPMPFFYDPDVPEADARAVLQRMIAGMRALPAVWMMLFVERTPPAGREGLLRAISREAAVAASLTNAESRWLLAPVTR